MIELYLLAPLWRANVSLCCELLPQLRPGATVWCTVARHSGALRLRAPQVFVFLDHSLFEIAERKGKLA